MVSTTLVSTMMRRCAIGSVQGLRAVKRAPGLRQNLCVSSVVGARASWRAGGSDLRSGFGGVRSKEIWRYGGRGLSGSAWRARSAGDGKVDTSNPPSPAPAPPSSSSSPPSPPPTNPNLTAALKTALPHEKIWNIPNLLTFSRLIATPLLGALIIQNQHLYAFTLFLYAGISDLLDGYIARRFNLQTVVGSVVDPMADKALMTTLVVCLSINGLLPLPLATLILGRDVSLAIAALYYRYASLPAPKTMRRYWDFSLPSAEVHPTGVSKINTFLQLGLIGVTMGVGLLHDPIAMDSMIGGVLSGIQNAVGGAEGVSSGLTVLQGVVAATTVYSGLSYAWMKDAVKILGDDEKLKKVQGRRGRMIIGGFYGVFVLGAAGLAWREWERREEVAVVEESPEEK